ncbi:MAG TPA: calcium-binding protein [Pseudomonas sp.]
MALINGTESGETLNGTNQADTINGLGGDDTLNGGNGADTLNGDAGNDTLNGGNGDDVLNGSSGDDILNGGNGADTLTGGTGDDILTGGNDPDIFKYSFTVTEGGGGSSSFTDWLIANGLGSQVNDGEVADGTTQNVFSTQYTGWLNHLVSEYGLGEDLDGDGIVNIGLNQNDASADATPWIEGISQEDLATMFSDRDSVMLKTGKVSQERYYSDDFSFGSETQVTSSDGNDRILDFDWGSDKLDFSGLGATVADAKAMFLDMFTLDTSQDVNGDGTNDSVLSLATDSSWSLTLIGVNSYSLEQIADSAINFNIA